MNVLVLADRVDMDLLPPGQGVAVAQLPVAGKWLLEHCLEELREAGCQSVAVALPSGASAHSWHTDRIRALGLQVRFLETRARSWPNDQLLQARFAADEPCLVVRGDVLRARSIKRFMQHAAEVPGPVVHALSGDQYLGVALVRTPDLTLGHLDWTYVGSKLPVVACRVDLEVRFSAISNLANYHGTVRDVLGGAFPGVFPAGRATSDADGIWMEPRVAVAASAALGGQAHIGTGSVLHEATSTGGFADIGVGCVIDAHSSIVDSIVLAGTYVGAGTNLRNAVAVGPWLYRVDLDVLQRVDDPLLLA